MRQASYYSILALVLLFTGHTLSAFILITTLYNEKSDTRLAEYIECLERNLAHPLIERIHVLYDTAKDDQECKMLRYLQSKPITLSYITGRPTYGMCFNLANTKYPDKKIIVSNADIYFNQTLNSLVNYDLTNTFIGLTRWNVRKDGKLYKFKQYNKDGRFLPVTSAMSQDVWIFKAPLAPFENDAIELGTMTCDTLIAFQAYKAQLKVLNPCHSVQAIHLHMSNIRNYNPLIMGKGPIREIPWTRLPEPYAQPVPTQDTIMKKLPTFIPSAYEHESGYTLSLKNTQGELFLKTIARAFNVTNFIKTSSSKRALIAEAAKLFKPVTIIQENQTNFASSQENLKVYSQGVQHFFKHTHKENTQRHCVFFDGHADAGALMKQLAAWASTNKPNKSPTILVIDQLHLLTTQALTTITTLLKSVHSNYKLVVTGDNKLIAYPPREHKEVSPLMRACTISRLYNGTNFSFKDVIQAEGTIAEARGEELAVLQNLRDTFAHTSNIRPSRNGKAYYYLWNGLALLKQGRFAAAHQEFLQAHKHGLCDWRIQWYLDRSTPAH
jgi:hypothetical protein